MALTALCSFNLFIGSVIIISFSLPEYLLQVSQTFCPHLRYMETYLFTSLPPVSNKVILTVSI